MNTLIVIFKTIKNKDSNFHIDTINNNPEQT